MKTKMRKWFDVLLGAILGMFGLGCFSCGMYGVPTSDFIFEGQVTDENKKPLPRIQVVRRSGWGDDANNRHWSEFADTLYTDANGNFYEYLGDNEYPGKIHKVIVNDTSGVYQSDSTIATVEYSGGHGWYKGKADLKLDFKLKKK